MYPLPRLIAVVTLALAASAAAQCPHAKTELEPATSHATGAVPCGWGITFEMGGVQVQADQGQCPLSIITKPPRDISIPCANDCGYRTLPSGGVMVTATNYHCQSFTVWLFFTKEKCIESGPPRVVNTLTNYRMEACEVVGTVPIH